VRWRESRAIADGHKKNTHTHGEREKEKGGGKVLI